MDPEALAIVRLGLVVDVVNVFTARNVTFLLPAWLREVSAEGVAPATVIRTATDNKVAKDLLDSAIAFAEQRS